MYKPSVILMILHTTIALNKINGGQTIGYSYLYDQLNRLLGMRQHNIPGTSWSHNSFNPAYEEKFNYDANGNIKTLVRKGANVSGMPLAMDNLKYFYYYTNTSNARATYDPTIALPGNVKSLSNQLAYVTDTDPAGNYTDDIDNQTAGNYDYDNIGNLIKDVKDSITGIKWTVYGKIKQITKASGVVINYGYDVSGNRISKEIIGAPGGTTKQFYIRDASGNTMSIYNSKTSYVEWVEQHLYGSSRLGIWNYGKQVPLLPLGVGYDSMMVGSYNYELTNHLGNVLSVISDKKVGVSAGKVTVDYYNAEVLGQNDYYAFGSQMPGRKYSVANTNYRFGFNGKEKDNEIMGEGNNYDFGARILDPRLGRFLSVDPLAKKFAYQGTYNYAENNPIRFIDIDGMSAGDPPSLNAYSTNAVHSF